jgi:uncharacterized protein
MINKNYMKYMLLCIVCILCIQCIQAYDYPTIKPFVNDFTGKLTENQINFLNLHSENIKQNTSYEIAIVLVKTTDGQDRLDYANHIGENAGVGNKETDNGLVVLWTEDNERGIAIAVGRGAETYINDAKAADIARAARHLFEEGKYYEGMEQMLTDLENTIHQRDTTAKGTGNNSLSDPAVGDLITILIVCGVIGLIIYLILSKMGVVSRPRWSGRSSPISIGTGGGGFGGGGFSGGSFGGGGGRG